RRGGVGRRDHRHLTAREISGEVRQSIVLILRPVVLNRHVLAFEIATLANAMPERGHKVGSAAGRRGAENPDHRHRLLLRARREGPRRRAADERDELAPPHSITSSARASRVGGTVRPSAFAVARLMTSSNLVGRSTGMSAGLAPLRILST